MKLTHFRNLFLVIASILFVIVDAHGIAGLTYIECELRPKERSSRVHHHDFQLMNEQDSSYESFTHPHIPIEEGTSQNWSGYVAATNLGHPQTGSVTAVYGSWIVPTLAAATHNTWCSLWVGIDGYTSNSVEQIGTEHDWYNGHQQNYAWFEMYPNYSYEIVGFPARPGDIITASVEYKGKNVFLLSIANVTAGVHTTIPTSYTTAPNVKRSSAEWILEAPYSGGILPLSHFNVAYFSNCTATINSVHDVINGKHWQDDMLTMVTANHITKALPSGLMAAGKAFNVVWKHE